MRYRFGPYLLDTLTLELRRASDDGEGIGLEPQVFAVLSHLIEHRDRVVPKEELLDEIWGDRFVSESTLTTRIKQVRAAVGDDGRRQEVIRTAHGAGYRFVADVVVEDPPQRSPTTTAGGATLPIGGLTGIGEGGIPHTHYATSMGASIAYQTFGEGPDLVLIAGYGTNVEVQWEHPAMARFLRRLGSFARVTVLDKRGCGLSDRMPHDAPPSLEQRADDLRAVMDDAGVETATLLGSSEGGSLAIMFAAAYPDRVDRLVLHNTWSRHPGFVGLWSRGDLLQRSWGTGAVYAMLAPSLGGDEAGRRFLARYERQSATPGVARALYDLLQRIDVSAVLPAIGAPTLVLHRRLDDPVPLSAGEELAAGIPDARLVVVEGHDHFIMSGDAGPILDAIESFVAQREPDVTATADRVLATVLFVDIVGSTSAARQLGDRDWARILDEFDQLAGVVLSQHRGELVKATGDGLLATFDGPGRAVMAACTLRDRVAPLGISVRAGLHTAEIERRDGDVAGIGVHLASRVAGAADDGEVWVSRTITDLVAGTGLRFADRGAHELKGLDQPWQLFEVRG
jgi:class 3 adenylate cyclase/pimeloyl-ACP methyl ester carboxylesterase/DNA-binding winged helix-turn-helix (wHTH) protein